MTALILAALLAAADLRPWPARSVVRTLPYRACVSTLDGMRRYCPELAQILGMGGRAVLACNVAIRGELRDFRLFRH